MKIQRKRSNPRPNVAPRASKRIRTESFSTADTESSKEEEQERTVTPAIVRTIDKQSTANSFDAAALLASLSDDQRAALFAMAQDPSNRVDNNLAVAIQANPSIDNAHDVALARQEMFAQNEQLLEEHGGGVDKTVLKKCKIATTHSRKVSKMMSLVRANSFLPVSTQQHFSHCFVLLH